MLRPCENADEPPKDQLKASLCFGRRKLGYWVLLADNVLQLRDEVDHQAPVRLQRFPKRLTPRSQVVFALAEQRTDENLERLGERRIWNVSLVLVELAGRK